jgi:hypothetical protein
MEVIKSKCPKCKVEHSLIEMKKILISKKENKHRSYIECIKCRAKFSQVKKESLNEN